MTAVEPSSRPYLAAERRKPQFVEAVVALAARREPAAITTAAIAQELHLSESSIEKYASSLFSKLGLSDERHVHRRVAAVLAYLQDQRSARPIEPDR